MAGIPVTLHYSFFLLLFIEVFISLRYMKWPLFILFVVVLYGPVLLLTIVVHEFGHALTTKKLGGRVEGIVLWPLGGFALCGPTEELGGDLKVALMGPMMHIPMALVWWGIYLGITAGKNGLWPSWTINLETVSTASG
jgi:Zn-dependent protease